LRVDSGIWDQRRSNSPAVISFPLMTAKAFEGSAGLSLHAPAARRKARRTTVVSSLRNLSNQGPPRSFGRSFQLRKLSVFIIRGKDLQDSFYFREHGFPGGIRPEEFECRRRREAQPSSVVIHKRLH